MGTPLDLRPRAVVPDPGPARRPERVCWPGCTTAWPTASPWPGCCSSTGATTPARPPVATVSGPTAARPSRRGWRGPVWRRDRGHRPCGPSPRCMVGPQGHGQPAARAGVGRAPGGLDGAARPRACQRPRPSGSRSASTTSCSPRSPVGCGAGCSTTARAAGRLPGHGAGRPAARSRRVGRAGQPVRGRLRHPAGLASPVDAAERWPRSTRRRRRPSPRRWRPRRTGC